MKTVNSILGILLSFAFLLSGCMKDDIDELRRQQAESDQRLTALEDWQKSTNSQIASLQGLISALENNDYVTGVSPVKEGGVEIGYAITFSKSSAITIYHGKKGEKGDVGTDGHAPLIGIAKDTDDKYYWTLDGKWLQDESGKKIPVTGDKGEPGEPGYPGSSGQNGATPKVAIGSDNYWYISANGTATGIPPAKGWTSTGVKATGAKGDIGATGPQGPKGDQGDAIFAADGIDFSNADYVIFTLADGVTTIKLPKYKSIGISFDQPGIFAAGSIQDIIYTNTGSIALASIRIVDLPQDWKYTVDYSGTKITIIPPSIFTARNFKVEATVLAGVNDRVSAMYALTLTGDFTGSERNELGAIYYQNGIATGMVYIPAATPGTGRVISLSETNQSWWGPMGITTNAQNKTDGLANMKTVYEINGNKFDNYPVFLWVHALNPTGTTYTSGDTDKWYLPSSGELGTNSNSLYQIYARTGAAKFDAMLVAAGGVEIYLYTDHWASNEYEYNSAVTAYGVLFSIGQTGGHIEKTAPQPYARAILAF